MLSPLTPNSLSSFATINLKLHFEQYQQQQQISQFFFEIHASNRLVVSTYVFEKIEKTYSKLFAN